MGEINGLVVARRAIRGLAPGGEEWKTYIQRYRDSHKSEVESNK